MKIKEISKLLKISGLTRWSDVIKQIKIEKKRQNIEEKEVQEDD